MAPPFFFSFGKGFPAIEAVFSLFFGIHPTRPFYPLFPPYGGSSKSTHPPPPSEKNRKHAIKDAEGFDVTANPEQIFFPKNLSDDQRLGWFQMVHDIITYAKPHTPTASQLSTPYNSPRASRFPRQIPNIIGEGKRIDNGHQQHESDTDSDVNSCQTVQRRISNDDVFSIAIPMETPPCASEPLCPQSESPRQKRQRLGINPDDVKASNFITVEGEGWESDEHSEFDMDE